MNIANNKVQMLHDLLKKEIESGTYKQGEKLRATFQTHLRQGDIYTKYSEGQYLLLCVGVERENIPDIGMRIDMDYRKRCGGRSGINCGLLDDGEIW